MMLTTNEIAEKVNLTRTRITQLIRDRVIMAEKRGRDWMVDESQIEIIKNLPENRGKYQRSEKSRNRKVVA